MEDRTFLQNIFPGEKGKKGSDFRDCMKHTTGSTKSCRVGGASVGIRAGPAALLQLLK